MELEAAREAILAREEVGGLWLKDTSQQCNMKVVR